MYLITRNKGNFPSYLRYCRFDENSKSILTTIFTRCPKMQTSSQVLFIIIICKYMNIPAALVVYEFTSVSLTTKTFIFFLQYLTVTHYHQQFHIV